MPNSLRSHGLQHTRLLCLSLSPGICSNSCPVSWWCHPTISFSVAPFSFCFQSLPASGSFPMSWLIASGGQSTGALTSALPMNIQCGFLQDWLVWSPCSPSVSQESFPAPQLERISSSKLSLLYPTLTSLHDYWKNYSYTWIRNLWNSMKLWAMSCRATQEGWIIAESSDKMWSTGGGNGKPPLYTCHENLMKCIKGEKNTTLKNESPRSESVQYATG